MMSSTCSMEGAAGCMWHDDMSVGTKQRLSLLDTHVTSRMHEGS